MKIKDKIFLDRKGLEKEGPINIVVFGDSATWKTRNCFPIFTF